MFFFVCPYKQTRKRKIVSNIFSQKNVLEFEPYVRSAIALLLKRFDDMYTTTVINHLPSSTLPFGDPTSTSPENEIFAKDGRVWFDCLNWYNFLAFDIIGDLAFGSPFGMLRAGKDSAPVAKGEKGDDIQYLPAVEILNYRGTYSASLGVIPPWARYVLCLSFIPFLFSWLQSALLLLHPGSCVMMRS